MRHFLSLIALTSVVTVFSQEPANQTLPPVSPLQTLRTRVSESDMEEATKTKAFSDIAQAEKQLSDAKAKTESLAKRTAALETVSKRAEEAKAALKKLEGFKPSEPQHRVQLSASAEQNPTCRNVCVFGLNDASVLLARLVLDWVGTPIVVG